MRFYQIDRIIEIKYGEYVTGVKAIALAEDVFNEHFPGFPVYPGSLLLEGGAQLAGSFFELTMEHQELPLRRCVLSIVNRFKFRRPAYPGDRLLFRVTQRAMHTDYGVAAIEILIGDELCAEGELTFTFHAIANQLLHEARAELYRLWLREVNVVS
jgi:3-hydroxyacyl-[acyl-carrier-protein] dehydratase